MRGRVILLISILSIFLVGCSFNKKDEINLVEQGKTYLEKHNYKKLWNHYPLHWKKIILMKMQELCICKL